jgi:phosphoserine phosphatase RsbU/P
MDNPDQNPADRILIVDDTLENIQVLGIMLRDREYQINVAQNGPAALELANKIRPDLILLDIMMPEMDGYEVCDRLKQNPDTSGIPVVFLTARTDTDSIVAGFEKGAVDYITKPFRKAELLIRVKTHLDLHRSKLKLQQALDEVQTLRGIIPICASCKSIRDDSGYWKTLETYIETHSLAEFSHGICPDCSEKLYGNEEWYQRMKEKQSKK